MERMNSGAEQILKKAVFRMNERELHSLKDKMQQKYQPSDQFMEKMKILFEKDKKRIYRRRMIRGMTAFAATAAIFILLLIFNEDVRAFFPFFRSYDEVHKMTGYQTVEKEENAEEKTGKIVGFELTYVPEGFVYSKELSGESTEDFGDTVYENKEGMLLDLAYSRNGIPSVNNEFTDVSTISLEDGTICDFYQSHTKGYASGLVWKKEDMLCSLSIDNNLEGWEDGELLKAANGIKAKYDEGTAKGLS